MSDWIMNARMYAVTPEAESLWRELLAHIAREAQVPLTYIPYPAPRPLEDLWSRPDLGAVLMCGYPIAMRLAAVVPLAAPIPSAPWAEGRALYRTDLIVRDDAPYRTLEDTFGGRAGWTVRHSQSGFNAFRHHLLAHRSAQRPRLYAQVTGELITARNVLDAVRERRIDIGPLDAYWHLLVAQHAPQLVAGVRVLDSTPCTPMPPFVAAAGMPQELIARLRSAFGGAAGRPWFAPFRSALLLAGFEAVEARSFEPLLQWEREALDAGYELPA
ncbi:MAG: PhnD/SsuA/transferrin family substrate-binding protein [Gammaproteobacteria bacterium]|nr:PhnD/SsuA/transferrin family substrate-binding protein [Gammaproteobacteria bacterium]